MVSNADVWLQFAEPVHIPPSTPQGPITLQNAPDRLFLRCERQVVLYA